MIDISREALTILMLGGFFFGVLSGYPLALVIGTVGLVAGILHFGPLVTMELFYTRAADGALFNYILIAVPLFIFMGLMLERSGIAEKLFDAMYVWLGGLRGGLAVIVILMGTIIAATVGVIAASVTMLAIVALRPMISRGYSRSLASGAVCAGGCLGILIPPSIMLVIYGPMAQISVGKLFFGAFIPGFLLSGMYMAYILIYSRIKPHVAPAVPLEERRASFLSKTSKLLTAMVPPVILILSVLGVIFFGIASPTEASGIGALAATLLTIAYGRFNFKVLRDVATSCFRSIGFIFLIVAMALSFVSVFIAAGCDRVISSAILSVPGGKWGVFAIVMFIAFIMGFFIDWMGIVFILVPIITPIAKTLGFDEIWFAMMICVNLQMSFMTPPFAWAIFFLRGQAPPDLGITLT
ncbi:MAG: TRAP transporter large permease subunit, partial [Dehalococcoidales bacterium]|nr:TRAP transporter large permease subunit [Dehalococcoidales bacterium]